MTIGEILTHQHHVRTREGNALIAAGKYKVGSRRARDFSALGWLICKWILKI